MGYDFSNEENVRRSVTTGKCFPYSLPKRKRTGTSGRFTEAQACRYAQGLLVALDGFCGL